MGSPAAVRHEMALGSQLCISTDDNPTRHAKLTGEQAARRQAGAAAQPTGSDAVAQLVLKLRAQWLVGVEEDVQIHSWKVPLTLTVAETQSGRVRAARQRHPRP